MAVLCSTVGVVVSGCAKKDVEVVWTPKPRVDWSCVVSGPPPALNDQYRVFAPQPTVGLFPANIAVTRVSVEAQKDNESEAMKPQLFADPRNEFLQWNRAFDDQMAVSEVFPIDQRDLGGGNVDAPQILAAFRALEAKLGLIYAVNELSPTETEMLGALYETSSAKPLAAFHARAVSIPPPAEDAPMAEKEKHDPADLWSTDSRALVRAKFERFVYAAVRELILNDTPSKIEPPAGWIPTGPTRPVEWPPRHLRPRG